jgi:hypothetical protein
METKTIRRKRSGKAIKYFLKTIAGRDEGFTRDSELRVSPQWAKEQVVKGIAKFSEESTR